MNITIFGGAQPKPGEPVYQMAYELGKHLAGDGHVVLTGGYIGTMEAASRGAAEAGGHVVGVTCAEIEDWRKIKPNAWVLEERRFATLNERLAALMDQSDLAIALPGGVGTLVEISLLWNRMIIQSLPARPLILIGDGWQQVFTAFLETQGGFVQKHDRDLLHFALSVDEAVEQVRAFCNQGH